MTFLAGHGEIGPRLGDPHGDPQTSPQHADSHKFPVWFSFQIGVLWARLGVAMWITHVGGQILPWPARKATENSSEIPGIQEIQAIFR